MGFKCRNIRLTAFVKFIQINGFETVRPNIWYLGTYMQVTLRLQHLDDPLKRARRKNMPIHITDDSEIVMFVCDTSHIQGLFKQAEHC